MSCPSLSTLANGAADFRMSWSFWRCLILVCPMCCAFTLFLIASARFVAAATIASAGVTVGCVMYLCFVNMVADILVVRVSLDHCTHAR